MSVRIGRYRATGSELRAKVKPLRERNEEFEGWGDGEYFKWTPHPVIVTIRDNKDYIRVLLYSFHTTITGCGVLLRNASQWLVSVLGEESDSISFGPRGAVSGLAEA